jgi:ssDNA-binding Zn-finger/Zn-ribbon topoisomerase 1
LRISEICGNINNVLKNTRFRRQIMKKAFVLFFVMIILGFALVSCVKDVISYCPFCGQAGIKEISSYDKVTGKTEVYYKCNNTSKCGKTFGAGQISPL